MIAERRGGDVTPQETYNQRNKISRDSTKGEGRQRTEAAGNLVRH